MPLWPLLCLGLLLLMASRHVRSGRHRDRLRRGARVVTRRISARRRSASRFASWQRVTLAGRAIPPEDESKHFKFIGATGTGKSTAIREILAGGLARGDRIVIADPDGGYRRRFFDRYRGDVVLNPFDQDSMRWDPFAELTAPYDAELIASALIPDSADVAAQEWRGYGRTLTAALLRRCQTEQRGTAELWRLLAVAPVEELRTLLAGTPAQPFLDPDNARMFGSIRAVAVSAMAFIEHVGMQRTAPMSVRSWVREGRGVLFFPYLASQIAALRSAIAAWLRLAIFEAMSQRDDRDQRLWFIIDELDALGAIDGLKDALARLRKFGGRCVLGFQSVAQVSSTYGASDAQTIIENCSTTLILRVSGSEQGGTSQFASRLIGEREVIRRQTSRGRDRGAWPGAGSGRSSLQISEQQLSEQAVLASELEQLPDLYGYLKTASSPGWRLVRLSPGQ
ncbi:MAG TPA: type IV secretion system DNA-binding domain-containing protein [Steroidobacteraceae bacterium]|jgi:type IV secretory pathway TraG/TraD family ATPase VirD4|nr:type IV secretion system DNA-binding domain-containing protein [Steroidobacteraceae bacterium]